MAVPITDHGNYTVNTTNGQYKKLTYTYDGTSHSGIHVFTTLGKNKQSLIPAISATRVDISTMNPNSSLVNPIDIIAKINGNWFNYDGTFAGIFYEGAGGKLYINQSVFSAPPSKDSYMYTKVKFCPSFCVKNDGTAVIRWFENPDAFQHAINACKCIIGAAQPLVFNGKCSTDELVYDSEPSHRLIYNTDRNKQNNQAQADTRFDFGLNASAPGASAKRTLLGHKSGNDGIYILVCTDTSITLKAAANLMKKLGCDYAVNMDGAQSVHMRIKSGYGPSGKVTSGNTADTHTAVCVHTL